MADVSSKELNTQIVRLVKAREVAESEKRMYVKVSLT